MAVTAITAKNTGAMNTGVAPVFTAIGTDGATVPIGKDERLVFIATNANTSAAKKVIVAKGDGINGAAANLEISVPANSETEGPSYVAFELDSSRYGKMSGDNKGKFSITSDAGADVSLMVIQLA